MSNNEILMQKQLEESYVMPSDSEWLPSDLDETESDGLPPETLEEYDASHRYMPNTVGWLISGLKRNCKMDDVLLPRVNKDEHFIYDVYSKAGRCVIDLAKGAPE